MSENLPHVIYKLIHWHDSMHNKLVECVKCEEKNLYSTDVKHDQVDVAVK